MPSFCSAIVSVDRNNSENKLFLKFIAKEKQVFFFDTFIAGLLNYTIHPKETRRLWERRHCHVPHHREPGSSH